MYKVGVITISDKGSKGEREDKSGKIAMEIIKEWDYVLEKYEIIPDDPETIKQRLIDYSDNLKLDLVLTTGGTGLGPRDNTPEATRAILHKEAPGIAEAMRSQCLSLTKRAMLSQGTAGVRTQTLIINLPGSSRGCRECLESIIEAVSHGLDMIRAREH